MVINDFQMDQDYSGKLPQKRIDYSIEMRCFVIGIPRIHEFNGHGELPISTVIAKDKKTALRDYLLRECPLYFKEVHEWLTNQFNLDRIVINAPSHDICNRAYGLTSSRDQIEKQNKRIAKNLAENLKRDSEDVYEELKKLLS